MMHINTIEGWKIPPLLLGKIEILGLDVIERKYINESIYVLCLIGNELVGTARIIKKYSPSQPLPIEGASLVSAQNTYPYLSHHAPISLRDTMLPACEIGALRISPSLKLKQMRVVLKAIMGRAEEVVFANKFKTGWVSCVQTGGLLNLYAKFSFKNIGVIRYGHCHYAVLFRYV